MVQMMTIQFFFPNLFLALSTLQGVYIIIGDFNCTLVPTKDRSTKLYSTHKQTRKILLQSCKDLNLVEIWKELHPDKVEYSCYSSTHGTHSQIVSLNLHIDTYPEEMEISN